MASFVNVVALRYGSGLSSIKGESRCLACNTELKAIHLVPILSYLFLRGRCTYCHSRLSPQYLLIEIISGLAIVYLYSQFFHLSIFAFLLLSTIYYILTTIFLYDLRHKIIPDLFVFLFILFSFLYSFFFSSLHTTYYILSTILVPLPFFLIWLFSRGRLLGLGDVKLMAGMGALLGLAQGFSAVFVSFWVGAACVIILMTVNRKLNMKSEIPFGPFLIIGTILTFCFNINLFKF